MAAFAGALSPFATAIVASGAPLAAEAVFLRGALARALPWRRLGREMSGRAPAREYFARCLVPVDLGRFPPPLAPQGALLIGARSDAFVEPADVAALRRHWPGSRLHWIDGGHVSAERRRVVMAAGIRVARRIPQPPASDMRQSGLEIRGRLLCGAGR